MKTSDKSNRFYIRFLLVYQCL